ncbi:hypothetical protein V6C53_12540 [Desulfocurvibacter africanus]|uniref:hypothetical protein n=1 Tax=Desulfocurvibacter africanus TaxID=873 RepID=UPI002FD8E275
MIRLISMTRLPRMTRAIGVTLLSLIAGFVASATPLMAGGYCSSYGVMCYRSWIPEERPGILSRWRAADGDYMGSIFLPEGTCSTLNLGLNCRPCEAAQTDAWSQACNERFSECLGKCFAQPE